VVANIISLYLYQEYIMVLPKLIELGTLVVQKFNQKPN